MIIISAMKLLRDAWIEALEMRRDFAKRYPGILAD